MFLKSIKVVFTKASLPNSGITTKGKSWSVSTAAGSFTNLGKTQVAGRSRRLACELWGAQWEQNPKIIIGDVIEHQAEPTLPSHQMGGIMSLTSFLKEGVAENVSQYFWL